MTNRATRADGPVRLATIPTGLRAPGTRRAPFTPTLSLDDVPPGSMRRWSSGDLDLLFAHTTAGIVVTEDRCPHMAAPLSIGRLDGCLVDCVLHRAVFDLSTGEAVQPPTIGGLGPDGDRIAPWTLPGSALKPEPSEAKARARALTRIRRIRFYPARIAGRVIEVRIPRT